MEEQGSDENRDPSITAEDNVYNGTAHKWQRIFWTQDGFIKDSDIYKVVENFHKCPLDDVALEGNEDSSSTRQQRIKRRKTSRSNSRSVDEDIRTEVCKEIWRRGTEFLNQAQQEARKYITKTIGFLFNDVGGAEWEYTVPRTYYNRLEDIPTARVYIGENLELIRDVLANSANKDAMTHLLNLFPLMVVHCQYDSGCEVYESEKARDNKSSGTVQRMRIARKLSIFQGRCTIFRHALFDKVDGRESGRLFETG